MYDLVVIGSGPGGYKAAIAAAHLGARVALVEKALAGGVCLNRGCIPKKTLHHLAKLIEDVNGLVGRGLCGTVGGDFPAAMRHKDEVAGGIRANLPVWLRHLGIRFVEGEARLRSPQQVEVTQADGGKLLLETRKLIIATGSRPRTLEVCPTDGRLVLDSGDFMDRLDALPESILCVGGGAVGTELAYMLRQFGAAVTLVESGPRLLNNLRLPDRARTLLERKFRRIGVDVRKETRIATIQRHENSVDVTFQDGTTASWSRVLVAVGRVPNSEGLGLELLGVELTPEGFVATNEYLETSVPGIFAIGDVKRGPMTANAALHEAKVVAANAVQGQTLRPNYLKVPVVIHSALEIAAVGLTEDLAEKAGFEPDGACSNLGGSGKGRAHNEADGFIEVVHDTETGQLLGGCIVGPEAGEQIHMLAAACQSSRGLWFFKDMSYSHPSWCEDLEATVDPYTIAFAKSEREIHIPGIFAELHADITRRS
jgi:dihydrolipoamide dehydrogenase